MDQQTKNRALTVAVVANNKGYVRIEHFLGEKPVTVTPTNAQASAIDPESGAIENPVALEVTGFDETYIDALLRDRNTGDLIPEGSGQFYPTW